jgi:lipid A 3-O-deacylase
MNRNGVLAAAVFWTALVAVGPMRADQDKKPQTPLGIFGYYIENDLAAGTDRNYTNGFKALWVSPELGEGEGRLRAPGWIDFLARRLPLIRTSGARRFFSLSLAQAIYTPEDISRSVPDPADRPYAGYLYAGLAVHSMDAGSLDTAEIDLGVVGPLSLAGSIQRLWHHTFGWDRPRGWAYQIKNEPVLALTYDHMQKILRPRTEEGFGRDAIVHAGTTLSNVFTGAMAGLEFRIGWNLPGDFGSVHIQPGSDSAALFDERGLRLSGKRPVGFHFFLALEGKAVVRDIFLDGNTFHDGPRVEKIPLVGQAVAGVALRYKRLKISFGYVFLSREFATQRGNQTYGSLNLAFTPRD